MKAVSKNVVLTKPAQALIWYLFALKKYILFSLKADERKGFEAARISDIENIALNISVIFSSA